MNRRSLFNGQFDCSIDDEFIIENGNRKYNPPVDNKYHNEVNIL